jgi:hypothetical protein
MERDMTMFSGILKLSHAQPNSVSSILRRPPISIHKMDKLIKCTGLPRMDSLDSLPDTMERKPVNSRKCSLPSSIFEERL